MHNDIFSRRDRHDERISRVEADPITCVSRAFMHRNVHVTFRMNFFESHHPIWAKFIPAEVPCFFAHIPMHPEIEKRRNVRIIWFRG